MPAPSNWISVNDRLPEDLRNVLVDGGVAFYDDGKWFSLMAEGLRNPREITWKVTHWMPLPEPPEVK